VTIPDSVGLIGDQAFANCSQLASANVPVSFKSNSNVGTGNVFKNCASSFAITYSAQATIDGRTMRVLLDGTKAKIGDGGDALVSGEAPSAAMAEISRAHGGASVVGLERVPRERISRYGIVAGTPEDDRVLKLTDLVEKPQPENAPSDLAIAGRYLLHPDIFALLASQTPGHGGEIQLTDSIRRLLAARPVYGYRYPGRRHDIGNPQGYLETLQAFA